MDKACGLGVFFLLAAVSAACPFSPGIVITSLKLEGLGGSCLLIPCNFQVKEGLNFPGLKSTAVWIRTQSQYKRENSEFVVFNGSRRSSKYPMEIIGDLKNKNCMTVFNDLKREYTDKYFFRVEDVEFKSTAHCDPINIMVTDSPWSPTLEVSGEQTESEVVTITCSAVTPCPNQPPRLTLNLQQHGLSHRLMENPDGTFNTTVTSRLALTSSHNGSSLTCSAAYPVNGTPTLKTATTTITLSVKRNEPCRGTFISPYNIVKLCGIILLYSSLLIFGCWFRATHGNKPDQKPKQTDGNRVIMELQA